MEVWAYAISTSLDLIKGKGVRMKRSARGRKDKNNPIKTFIASFVGMALGLPVAMFLMASATRVSADAVTSSQDPSVADITSTCGAPPVASSDTGAPSQPTLQTAMNTFTPPPAGGQGGGGTPQPPTVTQTGTISNTGPDSNNNITFNDTTTTTITNNNNVSVDNDVSQVASSGNATATNNTSGGSALSGQATNTSSLDVDIAIKN